MQNEDIIQNIEVLPQTDRLFDSPSDNQIEESITEPVVLEEPEVSETESEHSDIPEELVSEEETESFEEETIVYQTVEVIDYTETLLTTNERLQTISMQLEYCNCLLIVILLITLLKYVYKFFKMFF